MATCTIKFFGSLRKKAEGAEQDASGTTIREALESIEIPEGGANNAVYRKKSFEPLEIQMPGDDFFVDIGLD